MRNRPLLRTLHHAAPRSSTPASSPRGGRFILPAVALSFAAVLSGCSTGGNRWVKDGLSASLADAKYAACRRDAERLAEASSAPEEERAARVRRESYQCMKADGWSLARFDGGEAAPSHAPSELPAHSSEMRLAQASEAPSDKPSEKSADRPTSKVEEKKEVKEVKEVKVSKPDDDADDDSEE